MRSSEAAHLSFALAGLLSLYYAIWVLTGLVSLFQFPRETLRETAVSVLAFLLPASFLVAAGVYLLRNARVIALRYFAGAQEDSPQLNIRDLEDLAFSCVGLLVFMTAIPALARLGFSVIWLRSSEAATEAATPKVPEALATYVGTLIQVLAGAYLFFYGRRFASLWRRVTRLPRERAPELTVHCPHCGNPLSADDYRADLAARHCSKCKQLLPEGILATDRPER